MAKVWIILVCAIVVALVSAGAAEWTFSPLAVRNGAPGSAMARHGERRTVQGWSRSYSGVGLLKRAKRRWSPPPINILENDKGPFPKDINMIVSDSSQNKKVYYTMTGPGYDSPPNNLFNLDRETAMFSLNGPVDREQYPSFTLEVRVRDIVTHEETDLYLPITIVVDDVNDNPPQFSAPLQFTVAEKSPKGSTVGPVSATDRDQPGTLHVKIRYSLLTGQNLFSIHPETGVITTAIGTLDREAQEIHMVTVEIKDMGGQDSGLSTTGTATITLTDINDNPPTFLKSSYDASIQENESEKLILRIPVEDKDLVNTPNWISKFVITKGNDNGNFRITTDPKTNEGLLYVAKPLDYEKNKNINLQITAQNEAKLAGTTAQWMSIPVKVAVGDVDEGPEFSAPIVRFPVKENTPNGTLIGTYSAIDPETKSSAGIRYYKTSDPAGWVDVSKDTGELRVANTIDKESSFVDNGLYNISMKAVDSSGKIGTGLVILSVEDVNDNVPTLPPGELVLCEKEGEMGSVLVVAEDKDGPPFAAPFSFSLPDDHDGKWSVTRYNDTAATLKHLKDLPTGLHEVPLVITDLQGFGKTQTAIVRICECRDGICLAKDTSAEFGGLGVLAMLLPLLLLLLLALLLAFLCSTKRDKIELVDAGDSAGILLKSNTEALGDEVDSNLISVPTMGAGDVVKGSVKGDFMTSGWVGNKSASTFGGQSIHENGIYRNSTSNMQDFYSGQYDTQRLGQQFGGGMGVDYRQDSAFLHTWQTNGHYLRQKLGYLGTEEDGRFADDIIHAYGYEGVGSAAGSVGCCSDFGDNDNLDFLNKLGPKFNTLADVCRNT
ncbi:desmocollin 2-like protein [Gouania willdenowi]|uniref:Cadherin domain-containing protein n=1 Tax=Gouania willdenowi TaxID=441366 RepID=A0A8C5GHV7_GOUWI|nr:desmocollin-2 [Gouania willdenowi]